MVTKIQQRFTFKTNTTKDHRVSLASTSLQRVCCFLSQSSSRPGEHLQVEKKGDFGNEISFKLSRNIIEKIRVRKKTFGTCWNYVWNINEISAASHSWILSPMKRTLFDGNQWAPAMTWKGESAWSHYICRYAHTLNVLEFLSNQLETFGVPFDILSM